MAQTIDLSKLPPPTLVETLDFETIVSQIQTDLIARGQAQATPVDLTPVLALESEPLNLLLQACAYRELNIRSSFNQRALATLLAYAKGDDLSNVVVNLGVERETGELDGPLLTRALLAPASWSVAGPGQAYQFFALSADASITDAAVSSPSPGVVRIAVLTNATDGTASSDVLASVTAAVSPDAVRPLTDNVDVVSGSVLAYDVTATIIVGSGPDPATVEAAATAAIQAYAAAARVMGRKVPLNALIAALMPPGASDLELTAPSADVVPDAEVAPQLGTLTLSVSVSS